MQGKHIKQTKRQNFLCPYQEGIEGQWRYSSSLTSALHGTQVPLKQKAQWVPEPVRSIYPMERNPVPTVQELVGPKGRSELVQKI